MRFIPVIAFMVSTGSVNAGTYYESFLNTDYFDVGYDSYHRSASGFILPRDNWFELPGYIQTYLSVHRYWDLSLPGGRSFSVLDVDVFSTYAGTQTGSTPPPDHACAAGDMSCEDDGTSQAYQDWLSAGGEYQGLSFGIYGIRSNEVVAALEFSTLGIDNIEWKSGPTITGSVRLQLGPLFNDLDTLRFSLLSPEVIWSEYGGWSYFPDGEEAFLSEPDTVWCRTDQNCYLLGLEGMTIHTDVPAPVPLPSALALLPTGLLLLGFPGWRRARKHSLRQQQGQAHT